MDGDSNLRFPSKSHLQSYICIGMAGQNDPAGARLHHGFNETAPRPAHLKLFRQELVSPKIKERRPCSFSKSNAALI